MEAAPASSRQQFIVPIRGVGGNAREDVGEPRLRIDAVDLCRGDEALHVLQRLHCGGPHGYGRLLEILADPDDEEYAEKLTWCGGPFDPTRADLPALEAALDRFARRWNPRSRAAAKPRT